MDELGLRKADEADSDFVFAVKEAALREYVVPGFHKTPCYLTPECIYLVYTSCIC